jgi:hypothetical protein
MYVRQFSNYPSSICNLVCAIYVETNSAFLSLPTLCGPLDRQADTAEGVCNCLAFADENVQNIFVCL